MKIGLLSDTHSYLDPSILGHLADCDEIWHAGDIGDLAVADALAAAKPFRAVWGNIDGAEARLRYPQDQVFEVAGLRVWMTHIGGYPPRYTTKLKAKLDELRPDLFICGHSHILKAVPDPARQLLHLNPGAAGREGFHQVRTLLRFQIGPQGTGPARLHHLEVVELGRR
jgi:putative phosphoesterase